MLFEGVVVTFDVEISAGDDVDNTEVDSWTDQSSNGYVGNKEVVNIY